MSLSVGFADGGSADAARSMEAPADAERPVPLAVAAEAADAAAAAPAPRARPPLRRLRRETRLGRAGPAMSSAAPSRVRFGSRPRSRSRARFLLPGVGSSRRSCDALALG